jgi:hypothetical protein
VGWCSLIEPMQPAAGDGARRRFSTQRVPWPGSLRVFVGGISHGPADADFGWSAIGPSEFELRSAPADGIPVEAFYASEWIGTNAERVGDNCAVVPPTVTGPVPRSFRRIRSPTLYDSLITVVDDARRIRAELGLRPVIVRLVWVGWAAAPKSGRRTRYLPGEPPERPPMIVRVQDLAPSKVGVGVARVLQVIELEPRPLVSGGPDEDADEFGMTERGSVTVSQISARYSEDLLAGLAGPFRDPVRPWELADGIEFFWELADERAAGWSAPGRLDAPWMRQDRDPAPRRYQVAGVPQRPAGELGWTVRLVRADGDRARDGRPSGAER